MNIDYLNALLGKPWEAGATGPDAYDCWGLTVAVQRDLFGRILPVYSAPPTDQKELAKFVANAPARKQWQQVDKPVHGGIVELAGVRDPFHIGVYLDIDHGGLLHCIQGHGVRFDPLTHLRASGWRKFIFHDYINS